MFVLKKGEINLPENDDEIIGLTQEEEEALKDIDNPKHEVKDKDKRFVELDDGSTYEETIDFYDKKLEEEFEDAQ